MRETGFEPARDCSHKPLKLACLPFHHSRKRYPSNYHYPVCRSATTATGNQFNGYLINYNSHADVCQLESDHVFLKKLTILPL